MKRIKNLLLPALLIVSALTIQSCKKSGNDTETVVPSPVPPPTKAERGDYQPTTEKSIWNYADTLNYSVTMGKDTTILGVKWRIATNSRSGQILFRKESGNYYQTAADSNGVEYTLLYLKDTVPVTTTWSQDVTVNSVKSRYQYTIIAVGLTKTIGTTKYENVIQVHSNTYADFANNGIYTSVGSADYYYAKDIGFIYSNIKDGVTTSLTTFNIN